MSNFTVNGGLLIVNGTIGTGDSVVAVNADTLGGHGVVNGGANASATLTVLFKAPAGVESVLLNGQIKFTLLADPNSIYYLRYRTNLLDGTWLDLPGSFITNNTAGAVPIELKDMAATNTLKFYRIGFLPLTP